MKSRIVNPPRILGMFGMQKEGTKEEKNRGKEKEERIKIACSGVDEKSKRRGARWNTKISTGEKKTRFLASDARGNARVHERERE